jgi:hypothetical protein
MDNAHSQLPAPAESAGRQTGPETLAALAQEIYYTPQTDFKFADGRTRHVTYGADGLVDKIQDGGNINHINPLNGVSTWERTAGGDYTGRQWLGAPLTPLTQPDAVAVEADGSILLYAHSGAYFNKNQSAVLHPDGSDELKMVDNWRLGHQSDRVEAPDGSGALHTQFADGSMLTVVYDEASNGRAVPHSITLASNGGTISMVANAQGADWQAIDPSGKMSEGRITAAQFQESDRLCESQDTLSIDWYKADAKGVRYDVVTDKSGIQDAIWREIIHIEDKL